MEGLHNIAIIFLSIFLESLPFILFGSILSAIIERYVSNDTIVKLIPKNTFLGSLVGVLLGFFIPACDCAVIPVSKRLIKKGVPINVAISFMLASPIINPVVLLSTYYAFSSTNMSLFWLRLLFGMGIAFVVGSIMKIFFKGDVVKETDMGECHHDHSHDECGCHHDHSEEENCCHHEASESLDENMLHDLKTLSNHDFQIFYGISKEEWHHEEHSALKKCFKNDILLILKHTAYDLFDILKFLIIGAAIAASIQVLLPQTILNLFESNKVLSIFALMLFAYLLSLCSTSDSFIGKSLLTTFSANAVLGYLLLGPMIDIKNTIVLLGNYKKSFTATLIFLIFLTILIACTLVVI